MFIICAIGCFCCGKSSILSKFAFLGIHRGDIIAWVEKRQSQSLIRLWDCRSILCSVFYGKLLDSSGDFSRLCCWID